MIIAAHGNTIRALVKHLDQISDEDIEYVNIPTGTPLVYEFDNDLKLICHYYLRGKRRSDRKKKSIKQSV